MGDIPRPRPLLTVRPMRPVRPTRMEFDTHDEYEQAAMDHAMSVARRVMDSDDAIVIAAHSLMPGRETGMSARRSGCVVRGA